MLKNLINCKVSTLHYCALCNKSKVFETEENIVTIDIPSFSSKKSYDFKTIFQDNFAVCRNVHQVCSFCKQSADIQVRKYLRSNGSVIFIKINPVVEKNDSISINNQKTVERMRNIKIKSVSDLKIKINGSNFSIKSAILKETLNAKSSYACLTKNLDSKWTYIKNDYMEVKNWPRNSKGVDVFLLQINPLKKK